MKNRSLTIIFGGTLVLSLMFGTYQMSKNQTLEASITQAQTDAGDQIEDLQKEIAALQDEVKSNDSSTVEMNDFIRVGSAGVVPEEDDSELINEEDLLENYFTETPILIDSSNEAGTQVNQAAELPENTELSGAFLVATPQIFDFGTISKSTGIVTADFELKNEGTENLVLNYAFTSCGCSTTSIKEAVTLAPRESYPLQVEYDPNYYPEGLGLGQIEKTVTVFANTGLFKVYLRGEVMP